MRIRGRLIRAKNAAAMRSEAPLNDAMMDVFHELALTREILARSQALSPRVMAAILRGRQSRRVFFFS
jgi:hypothetical protein